MLVLASKKLSNITIDLSDCPCHAINNEPFLRFLEYFNMTVLAV